MNNPYHYRGCTNLGLDNLRFDFQDKIRFFSAARSVLQALW